MDWRKRSEYKAWLLSLPEYEVVTWGDCSLGNFHANGVLYFIALRGSAAYIEILRDGYPEDEPLILGQLTCVVTDYSKYTYHFNKFKLRPEINLMTIYLKEKSDEY